MHRVTFDEIFEDTTRVPTKEYKLDETSAEDLRSMIDDYLTRPRAHNDQGFVTGMFYINRLNKEHLHGPMIRALGQRRQTIARDEFCEHYLPYFPYAFEHVLGVLDEVNCFPSDNRPQYFGGTQFGHWVILTMFLIKDEEVEVRRDWMRKLYLACPILYTDPRFAESLLQVCGESKELRAWLRGVNPAVEYPAQSNRCVEEATIMWALLHSELGSHQLKQHAVNLMTGKRRVKLSWETASDLAWSQGPQPVNAATFNRTKSEWDF